MAIFCVIFASYIFSEPRAAHFIYAFYIRTKDTPCVEVWKTSNFQLLRLGEEKKDLQAQTNPNTNRNRTNTNRPQVKKNYD